MAIMVQGGETAATVYSITDIARAIGLSPQAIGQRIRLYGTLPEPTIRIGKRLFFDEKTFRKIVRCEKNKKRAKPKSKLKK